MGSSVREYGARTMFGTLEACLPQCLGGSGPVIRPAMGRCYFMAWLLSLQFFVRFFIWCRRLAYPPPPLRVVPPLDCLAPADTRTWSATS